MRLTSKNKACGAHQVGEATPGSDFDYTCDDCMLQEPHLDPPELANNEKES